MDRGERRRRTEVIATQRREHRLRVIHGGDASTATAHELSTFFYAKQSAVGCRDRKRKHGQPRLDVGLGCKSSLRDRVYAGRRQWREWSLAAVLGRIDAIEEPAPPRN